MKPNINPTEAFLVFMQYFSIVFFIVFTTIFVNFNHNVFTRVTKDKSKSLWWLFVLFMTPLLIVVLVIFGLIFGKINFSLLGKVLLGRM